MTDKTTSDAISGARVPAWVSSLDEENCLRMDVRPVLKAGRDPLDRILAQVDRMAPEDILLIEAPFDPIPLRRLMADRGFDSHVTRVAEGHWRVCFRRGEARRLPELPDLPAFPMTWRDGVLEMDLRGLEPPNPMIAILKVIESGEGGDDFTVRLMRDPIYLYPELVECNWQAQVTGQDDEGLTVRMCKVRKDSEE